MSYEDEPHGNSVQLKSLVNTMKRAADEEKRQLSSTRRIISRLSIARLMLAARRARTPFIDPALLGEPAWDILLFLYIAYREGTAVRFDAAMTASQMSPAVARRWIAILVDKGLVEPIAAAADVDTRFVYLTDKAVAAMEASIDHYLNTGSEQL